LVGRSRLIALPGLGHLAHEEDPLKIAEIVREAAEA
jgi:pimeloyl-ACP methyl ester carboxylesterase